MKYLFSNILGSFALDASLDIAEPGEEKELKKKYPYAKPLPPEKLAYFLLNFKDKKYYRLFYERNLALTKKAIKDSVSEDQLIIQTIANISEMDKASHLLAKRLREWYALYWPELAVEDNEKFAALVLADKKKEKESMGADLKKADVEEIIFLAKEVSQLYALRKKHEEYLEKVMKGYCPNLLELAGATIGAKLLELGKGLKHLALLPASTIQLLGAEKALFRHLKTGSRSPKYGIILQHQLVQKAKPSERGKTARRLADKLSLCARLDYFKGEFKAKEYRKELEEETYLKKKVQKIN